MLILVLIFSKSYSVFFHLFFLGLQEQYKSWSWPTRSSSAERPSNSWTCESTYLWWPWVEILPCPCLWVICLSSGLNCFAFYLAWNFFYHLGMNDVGTCPMKRVSWSCKSMPKIACTARYGVIFLSFMLCQSVFQG